jgi:hypothetical protein
VEQPQNWLPALAPHFDVRSTIGWPQLGQAVPAPTAPDGAAIAVVAASLAKVLPWTIRWLPLPSTGIASGSNLPVLHANDLRPLLPSNRGCNVCGSIIYHNDFIRFAKKFHPAANVGNTPANPSFLIVCWNDE